MPFRCVIAPSFDMPETRAEIIDHKELTNGPEAKILLDGRNKVTAVKLRTGTGRFIDSVVKEYRLRGVRKLKSLVQPSKAARAWRGAIALRDRGFSTPEPIAYLERRCFGFVSKCAFVAVRIEGAEEIRELFLRREEPELRDLILRLAPLLRRFHDAGLVHRDLSDGNILVRNRPEGGGEEFIFLDTNRVRTRRRLGAFGRARTLVRLGIPAGLQACFLDCYAAAPGAGPVGRSFKLWYRRGKRSFEFWLRLKKKLRLRSIARALKIQ